MKKKTDWEGVIGFILLQLQFKKIKRKDAIKEIMEVFEAMNKEVLITNNKRRRN